MHFSFSKSKYCAFRQCPKYAWLSKYRPKAFPSDDSSQMRLDNGLEVGNLAKGLFGDYVDVTVCVTLPMISDVIDLFGTSVRFSDKDEKGVTVTTITNERAMEQFALNYAPDVIVLKPEGLRKKIVEQLKSAVEAYEYEERV